MSNRNYAPRVLALALASVLTTASFQTADASTHIIQQGKGLMVVQGNGLTIIDIAKVPWLPMTVKGVAPGAFVNVLSGDLVKGPSEILLRLPANYTLPFHKHTSNEVYVVLQGDYTQTTDDGNKVRSGSDTYVRLNANVPHGIRTGDKTCIIYIRYSGASKMTILPWPKEKQ